MPTTLTHEDACKQMWPWIVKGCEHAGDLESWAILCRHLRAAAEELKAHAKRHMADEQGRSN